MRNERVRVRISYLIPKGEIMYTCGLCGVVFDIGDGKSTKEGSMCNTCYSHVYNEDDDFDPLAEDENFWGDYRMEVVPFTYNL